MNDQSFWQRKKDYIKKRWLTIAFILGFVTDVILLNRVDDIVDNLILLGYVSLATLSLTFFYAGVAGRFGERVSRFFVRYMPGVMQYSFGGLLSGMLIFYGRSGDWITSAPFLLLIISVIFINELIQKRSDRLVYHIALYYIGLFSYIVLVLPLIFGTMGDTMFFLSGIVALLWVTIVIQILYRIVPRFMYLNTKRVILVVGTIYMSINALYYTGILPPIPLSLTDLQMAHSVIRLESGDYRIIGENQVWWRQLPFTDEILNPSAPGLACFARIYTPGRLSTEIFHRWEYQTPDGSWVERARVKYPITATQTKGFRGWTQVSNVQSGRWRCSVETERGQVLGRVTAQVEVGGDGTPVTFIK